MKLQKRIKTALNLSPKLSSVLAISVIAVGCSSNSNKSVSAAEQSALSDPTFSASASAGPTPIPDRSSATSVEDEEDSLIPNNFDAPSVDQLKWVKRCDPKNVDKERAEAIAAAKADPTLIPVRYSISMGTPFDDIAYLAYRRSILRKDDQGTTPIYVGAASAMNYNSATSYHYVTDHSAARTAYINGDRCFYSTVKIKSKVAGAVLDNGKYNHTWALMHYGSTYSAADQAKEISPRLFAARESQTEPQVVTLFMADIREPLIRGAGDNFNIISRDFSQSATRNKEYTNSFKEIFRLENIFQIRQTMTEDLSKAQVVQKRSFAGIDGAAQLIDNILFTGLRGTVTSTSYTPILLDLGRQHIRTSSLEWGSFFNMARLSRKNESDLNKAKKVSHLTAWVGGYIDENGDSSGSNVHQRIAEDGFLVLPDASGKVQTSEELFGTFMTVDGKTYENGFEALKALAKKDCTSDDIKKRYVGPWDKELYSNQLKVWIDKNRNGIAEADELSSLESQRVSAINACNTIYQNEKDRFGNSTALRSAYLRADFLDTTPASEDELVHRIQHGKLSSGRTAEFRTLIDVYFKATPNFYLENIAQENITGL